MTDQPGQPQPPQGSSPYQGQERQGEPAAVKKKKKRKKRLFLWFFLAIQAIFIIWIITGVNASSNDTSSCGSLSAKACQDAQNAGAGIGVFLIIVLWVLVDIILGIGYGVYKLASRK